jgi:hypothetical protein
VSTLSRILASSPVNATAARVTSRSNETWEPNYRPPATKMHWKEPPATKSPSRETVAAVTWDNLTGRKFGRFTVVGWLGRLNAKQKGMWLVRCTCGDYEARTSRAIKQPGNTYDRCHDCVYLERVKRGRGNCPVPHLMPVDGL